MLEPHSDHHIDAITAARNRIQSAPPPSWADECLYDSTFKAAPDDHVTYLLFDRQVHAERRETFVHVALRLETMDAVQRESQWRLQFEPRTDSVTLHFLRIRRGEPATDHLDPEKGHLLQREEGLDRYVIHGWFTFLQVLDDVRPGDILEWAFTVQSDPQLLPEHCISFYNLPEWASIGKYHFSARFKTGRAMKWKASLPELKPVETDGGGLTVWTWTAEKYAGLKREPNTPFWYVSAPWIQISDCPDWQTVAMAISKPWSQQEDGATLEALVKEVEGEETNLAAKIERAIRLIQDEHRYFSVNLEFGGQIPAPPDVVARRRYGDCKDLSFLLVNLLKHLGVAARPVLVHTGLRRSVGDVLPAPGVFNHVVVEFEAGGKRRWVDVTMKKQGGGAFNRVIPDYGLGLPIDPAATGLVEPPEIAGHSNLYELHETILVDTTGAPSLMAVKVRAEGSEAEKLRHQFETLDEEEIAKQSLQHYANRFANAQRAGSLQHRYDRDANQFLITETFEISGFLGAHPDPGMCRFQIPSFWIQKALQMPEKKERRTPFALPHPYQVVHVVELESRSFRKTGASRFSHGDLFVQFNRTSKYGYGYWKMTFSLNTLADSVPPEELEKYRETVERIWRESIWEMNIELGHSKPKPRRSFGELPGSPLPPASIVAGKRESARLPAPSIASAAAAQASKAAVTPGGLLAQPVVPITLPSRRHRRRHRHDDKSRHKIKISPAMKAVGAVFAVSLLVILLTFIIAKLRH